MASRPPIRPPRKPARFRPLALVKLAAFGATAFVLATLLLKGGVTLAVRQSDRTPRAVWGLHVVNSTPTPIQAARYAVFPFRGGHALTEGELGAIAPGFAKGATVTVRRAGTLSVVLEDGESVHIFNAVARLDPDTGDSIPTLVIGPGPTLNGVGPD